jgi:ribonuclease J
MNEELDKVSVPQQKVVRPPKQKTNNEESVSIIPIGGVGDVTKNMYLYEYKNEILIVDCGIGFADSNAPGVDFLIPDISYLKKTNKRIVGMILTHGHEDHIGALPFILPSLPNFPIHATPLTAEFIKAKISDFGIRRPITTNNFQGSVTLGSFTVSFIRMTHSILDASNLLIKTPAGTIYHGSDYKFDFTPYDGKPSELRKIAKAGDEGILALLSDSVGSERTGNTPSEKEIAQKFEDAIGKASGKVYVTTYSSNIVRMNQAIAAALKYNRKICFIGRSFMKARDAGKKLGYMNIPMKMEVKPHEAKRLKPNQVLILLAGSQGQIESGLVRIASGDDRDLTITKDDTIIFSADPIPGNEQNVNSLVDMLSKTGAKVYYSNIAKEFHVSGHGSQRDIELMISLAAPKFVMPIGGTYKQLVAFREIAKGMGYKEDAVVIGDSGKEVIFTKSGFKFGRDIKAATVYVDQITGEEVDNFVILDRKKISEEGIVIVMVEVDSNTGEIVDRPDIITKGFNYADKEKLIDKLDEQLRKLFVKKEKVDNWRFYRRMIQEKTESLLYRQNREPLVIPVVVEV